MYILPEQRGSVAHIPQPVRVGPTVVPVHSRCPERRSPRPVEVSWGPGRVPGLSPPSASDPRIAASRLPPLSSRTPVETETELKIPTDLYQFHELYPQNVYF